MASIIVLLNGDRRVEVTNFLSKLPFATGRQYVSAPFLSSTSATLFSTVKLVNVHAIYEYQGKFPSTISCLVGVYWTIFVWPWDPNFIGH